MERQQQTENRTASSGDGGPLPENNIDSVRQKLDGMHRAAEDILNSLQPVQAEEYLQQGRQRSAQ